MAIITQLNYIRSISRSYKSKRQIIVIESDDWGSERIPNQFVQQQLLNAGIGITKNPYTLFDTLEREEDILALNDVLERIEKQYEKKIQLTANFILANPKYNAIEKNQFENYFYEHFTETYYRRDGDHRVLNALNELIHKKYMHPQFHGREHINISYWLNELRAGNPFFLKAFALNCFGIDVSNLGTNRSNLMAANEYTHNAEKKRVLDSICEGVDMFEKHFGYKSETAVSPRHVWDKEVEKQYQKKGIQGIQTSLHQLIPSKNGYRRKLHYTGEFNKRNNLSYLVRNIYFEPAYNQNYDWIKNAMGKIKLQFIFGSPVIISMHRLNFAGGLVEANRTENLKLFKELLKQIIIKYPNVEFLTSDQLLHLILSRKK